MEMDVIRQLEEQMKIFGIQVIRLRTGGSGRDRV